MPIKTEHYFQHTAQQLKLVGGLSSTGVEVSVFCHQQQEKLQSANVIKRLSGAASLKINWSPTSRTHAAFASYGNICQSSSRQPFGNIF